VDVQDNTRNTAAGQMTRRMQQLSKGRWMIWGTTKTGIEDTMPVKEAAMRIR
jgi:hypothetical protein